MIIPAHDEVQAQGPSIKDRQIRVFVSSTFRDMQADRDVLVKKVFPQLRKLCELRAVTWTEVDLRWGITSEQQAEGTVLPYCLAEIERSRPFFVGLLGERYGWVPQSISTELLEQQPWLREHLEHSVTELEILHGVLNNPAMAERALFYFRDPAYVAAALPEKTADFVEIGPDAGRMQQKLTALKDRIRTAAAEKKIKYPPRENYADPKALVDLILADFTRIINELYPPDEVPDPLDQEENRHDAYARSRRLAFVGREDLLRRLDEYVSATGKPIVLTGQSGCGKSALLAEWVSRWREKNRGDLIIEHYIGSTPDSADWQGLVRRILGELKRAYAIAEDIPVDPETLRDALNDWPVKAAGSGRVVLVLDALNQLADDGAARQLGWLPVDFPVNFRVLVSSLPGESFDALRGRGWSELNVPLFARVEVGPAARAYFTIFSKTPPKEIVAKLESTPAACNALYLRAVLDELRQFGRHEELDAKATHYLRASDPKELYERILIRWEQDFGEDLVRECLGLIWAARRGLSESELGELLGEKGQALPRATWTPFYLAAEFSLAQQAGLLTFSHSYVRDAVQDRYIQNEELVRRKHQALAGYFKSQREPTQRKLIELPWQCARAALFDDLEKTLTDIDVFLGLCDLNRHEIWSYWRAMPPDRRSFVHAYNNSFGEWRKALGETDRFELALNELEHFYFISGETQEGIRLAHLSYELAKRLYSEDDVRLAIRTNNLSSALFYDGKFSESLSLALKAQPVYEREFTLHQEDRWVVLHNIGHCLFQLGRFAEAEDKLRQVLDAERRYLGARHHSTLTTTVNLAILLQVQGRFSESTPLFEDAASGSNATFGQDHPMTRERVEHLRIHLEHFVNADPKTALTNLARHLKARGIKGEAIKRYREALLALEAEAPSDDRRIRVCLRDLVILLEDCGDHEGAQAYSLRLLDSADKIRAIEDREQSAAADTDLQLPADLNTLAIQLRNLGRLAEAEPLLRRALARDEKLRGALHPKIPHRLNNLCIVLIMQGKLDEAKPLLARAWRIKSGQHDLTSTRLLFVRLVVALLELQRTEIYAGQLKTLLAAEFLPDHADVAKVWDVDYFIEHLRPKLPRGSPVFLTALANALNDRTKLPDLDRILEWYDQPPIPLEKSWPD